MESRSSSLSVSCSIVRSSISPRASACRQEARRGNCNEAAHRRRGVVPRRVKITTDFPLDVIGARSDRRHNMGVRGNISARGAQSVTMRIVAFEWVCHVSLKGGVYVERHSVVEKRL